MTRPLPARPRRAARRAPAPATRRAWLGIALVVGVTTVAYWPALRGGFLLDDDVLLTNSELVRAPDGLYRMWFTAEALDYWPLSNSTFWIQWRWWGLQSTGYHVTNLALHIADALLLWVVLRQLSIPGAFLAALLFAVHPVNVESVAWIAQRKSLMAMLFGLASAYAYFRAAGIGPAADARGRDAGRAAALPNAWYWTSLVVFVLAMLSKGTVVVFPALLCIVLWWRRRPLPVRELAWTAPFFVVALGLALVNVWFLSRGGAVTFRTLGPLERLLGAAAAVWFYLSKALLPTGLTFIYPQWHVDAAELRWWLPLLAVAITTGGLGWSARTGWGRALLCAWLFYGAALLPVLGFTDSGFMEHSLVADHYQHLALIAVVALAGAGWQVWRRRTGARRRWLPTAAAATGVAVLSVLTWRQSSLYGNPATLYEATLARNPDAWLAHNNLGGLFIEAQRTAEAIEHLERAIALNPDYADAHSNLGIALRTAGRLPEAIAHYQTAIRLRPNYPEAEYNLGLALAQHDRLPEAIAHFRRSLELRPNHAPAYNDLGAALARSGAFDEALGHFQRALALQPDFADARYNLELAERLRASPSRK